MKHLLTLTSSFIAMIVYHYYKRLKEIKTLN